MYEVLNAILKKLGNEETHVAELTKSLHVLPYFHGNRSPRANPDLKGVVAGLSMDDSIENCKRQQLYDDQQRNKI